jgi:hypothetical protein
MINGAISPAITGLEKNTSELRTLITTLKTRTLEADTALARDVALLATEIRSSGSIEEKFHSFIQNVETKLNNSAAMNEEVLRIRQSRDESEKEFRSALIERFSKLENSIHLRLNEVNTRVEESIKVQNTRLDAMAAALHAFARFMHVDKSDI